MYLGKSKSELMKQTQGPGVADFLLLNQRSTMRKQFFKIFKLFIDVKFECLSVSALDFTPKNPSSIQIFS